MPAAPDFTSAFRPGENWFCVRLLRVMPPDQRHSDGYRDAYLIKLKSRVSSPEPGERGWYAVQALHKSVEKAHRFCDLWTPQVSELSVEEDGRACFDMVSYLHLGAEKRLIHLDAVVRASPPPATAGQPEAKRAVDEDLLLIDSIINLAKQGADLRQAVNEAQQTVRKSRSGRSTTGEVETGATSVDVGQVPQRNPADIARERGLMRVDLGQSKPHRPAAKGKAASGTIEDDSEETDIRPRK